MKIVVLIIGLFFFLFGGSVLTVAMLIWDNLNIKEKYSFLTLGFTGFALALYIFIKLPTL
jgi:hypothetical protein